ncbi:MAG: (d)CMP kinase [Oscillospiraceae bacterium]|nr:(d)CMP kinase [Oscillospiraceae bacterium]
MRSTSDVIVIGGGAAGLFAAGVIAEGGKRVTLLEKNDKVGRKLGITGKGRCNLTNNSEPRKVIENIPGNGRFLYSAVNSFTPQDMMEFIESRGVPLKTERASRVFPVSDRAADVVNALLGYIRETGVERVTATAKSLIIEDGALKGVKTDRGAYYASAVIVATGGVSYPLTGSTGDGYIFARQAGHTVVQPRASLVPLTEKGDMCVKMQGFSLKNVGVKFTDGKGRTVYEDFGELMFTHFGVTGPVILSASAHLRSIGSESYTLHIDLKPALDEKKLDERILRDFDKYRNRAFRNALSDLAGHSMIPVLVERSGIDPDKEVNSVTKEERRGLVALFKDFTVEISGTRPIEEAVVTRGGVSIKEIDPKTMESKYLPGLYFAGEVMDVDAYTGGFNLQIAWSTAHAAAAAILDKGENKMHINVAIDGPSGAGKSTLAKLVAKDMGLIYVDTGALYRTVGLYVLRKGVGSRDEAGVTALLGEINIEMRYENDAQRMILNGEDVTDLIRTPEVTKYASDTSAIPSVRAFLLDTQRSLAKKYSVIMDGRDIGTVVLPDSEVKIFLVASPEVRAARRLKDFEAKGIEISYEQVLKDIVERDYNDSHRAAAPLKPAEDSVQLDTSNMNVDEVKEAIESIIRAAMV